MIQVEQKNINRIVVSQDSSTTDLLRVLKPKSTTDETDTDMLWFGGNSHKTTFNGVDDTTQTLYLKSAITGTTGTTRYTPLTSSGVILEVPLIGAPPQFSEQGTSTFEVMFQPSKSWEFMKGRLATKIYAGIDVKFVSKYPVSYHAYVNADVNDQHYRQSLGWHDGEVWGGGSLAISFWISDDFRLRSLLFKKDKDGVNTLWVLDETNAKRYLPIPLQSTNLRSTSYWGVTSVNKYYVGERAPNVYFAGQNTQGVSTNYSLCNATSTTVVNGTSQDGSIDFEQNIYEG